MNASNPRLGRCLSNKPVRNAFYLALLALAFLAPPKVALGLSMVDQNLDQVWHNTTMDLDKNGTPDGGLVKATLFSCQPTAFGRMCTMRVDEWMTTGDISASFPIGSFFKFQTLAQNTYSAMIQNNSGDNYVLFLRPHESGDPMVMSMKVGRITREPVESQTTLSSTQFREVLLDPWSAPQTNGPENAVRKTGSIVQNDFRAFRNKIENLKAQGENK